MPALFRWLDSIVDPLACLPVPEPLPEDPREAEPFLRQLDALLRHRLKYAMAGERVSVLKGQGLDFADLREYQPGDDLRKMDWSVFARTQTPHVREYHEEKQLTVWLVVDLTPSMAFGKTRTKMRQAIDLVGLLGLVAHHGNYQLGAFLITSAGNEIIPPNVGYSALQRIVQRLLHREGSVVQHVLVSPPEIGTSLAEDTLVLACEQLGRVVQKNATVIVLSDFLASSDAWRMPLGVLSQKAQMLYVHVYDPAEKMLPSGLGLIPMIDPETGGFLEMDTRDAEFRAAYLRAVAAYQADVMAWLKKTGAGVSISTGESPLDAVAALLSGRVA